MLYIVATPVGNLQDITLRALETLRAVDKIYAEDTRRTRILLDTYEIKKPLESLHHHSSPAKLEQVIGELTDGLEIAYVTDAGTPGVADPGGILVQKALEHQIQVVPLPGSSAVTTLLSAAGLPANSFWFAGYVPTKKGRQTFVKKVIDADETVVLFETSPRLVKFLEQLIELGGETLTVVIGRELTKQFEEVRRGLPQELLDWYRQNPPKGELVIAVAVG